MKNARLLGFVLVSVLMLVLLTSAPSHAFASSGTTLQNLAVELDTGTGKLSPAFDPTVTDYIVLANANAREVRVIPTAQDSAAQIAVNDEAVASGSASSFIEMAYGRIFMVRVDVASPDGSEKTYSITVVRAFTEKKTSIKPKSVARNASITTGLLTIPPMSFMPSDAAVSPDHDTLCLPDPAGYRVFFADLSAGTLTPVSLPSYSPKKVAYGGGAWLVAMAKPLSNADKVAVIDPATLTVSSTISTDIVISGIAGDANYVYVYSGGILEVYSRDTGLEVSSISEQLSYLTVNPANGILYGIRYGYPVSFQVTNGQISEQQLHGASSSCSSLAVMPDGKHILLNCGDILTSSADKDSDLQYVTKVPGGSLVASDSARNEVYVVSDRLIQVYDASDATFKRVIPETQTPGYLMCSSGKLIVGLRDDSNVLTFNDCDTGAMLRSIKINGDAFSEFYPMHSAIDRGTVPNSMASVSIDPLPFFSTAAITGDVGTQPLAVGANTFTISVNNPSTGATQAYTITITRAASDPPSRTYNAFTDLGFIPMDAALDPSRPVLYMTSLDETGLYRVDLQTGSITKKEFDLPAESVTVSNGKIYVTLLRTGHNNVDPDNGDGFGAVAVVDAASFKVDSIFNTNIDPYDIAADDAGYVYLSPGSNQWSNLASYDSATGRPVSICGDVYQSGFLERNPVSGKLYLVPSGGSPIDITAFEVSDGLITKRYDSPYHGDYPMLPYMAISPDGKYIFDSAGTIFRCASKQAGDMTYVKSIAPFGFICFDLDHNKFYTAANKTLTTYNYNSLSSANTKSFSDYLIALFQADNGTSVLHYNSSTQVLYLKWLDPVTVTFNSQGGSSVATATVPRNGNVFAPAPPTRAGYTFGGWCKDAACAHAWNFSTDTVTSNITLYAKWNAHQYTVTFDSQGGSAVNSIQANCNTKIKAPKPPTRTDYVFGGWYKEAACVNAWNFAKDTVASNITLYAKWMPSNALLLSGIALSAGTLSPAFSQTTASYTVNLGENDDNVTVTPTKAFDGATMTIDRSMPISVSNGSSVKMKIVVAYDNKSKTYTLTIKRPKSTNNLLSSITASAGTFDTAFDPAVTKYKLTLSANTDSVTITAIKSSPLATITNPVKTYKLKNGQSVTYTISVKSQAGVTKKYTITVYQNTGTSASLSNIDTGSSSDFDIDTRNMVSYF